MCALVTGVQTCALPFLPRHPSQLYEAGLEGILLGLVLWIAFWKTRARYQPGKLVGIFLLGYGLARFTVEFFREADAQLMEFAERTGLNMGQWLTLPMILCGLYLNLTAKGRPARNGDIGRGCGWERVCTKAYVAGVEET